MDYRNVDNLKIENAHIMFRNFSGKASQYNKEGSRNFCVRIEDPEVAQRLKDIGWNIRILAARNQDEEATHYLPVSISFDNYPANVILHKNGVATKLTGETIGMLDFAEIKNIDLIVRPYQWEVRNDNGIKAYVKTMHVTLEEDPFEAKYASEESPSEDIPW